MSASGPSGGATGGTSGGATDERGEQDRTDARWAAALTAGRVFAVDPAGCGGLVVRAAPGPARDLFIGYLFGLLRETMPRRKLPPGATDDRLIGGLDLAATLRAGRPVGERGLLAEADGGVVVIPMAERLPPETVGRLCLVLDTGSVRIERDGFTDSHPARFGFVALDEGVGHEERIAEALSERAALQVDLEGLRIAPHMIDGIRAVGTTDSSAVEAARRCLGSVVDGGEQVAALGTAAASLGIGSVRAVLFALRTARILAALAGDRTVGADALSLAAALVLAPRATQIPETDAERPPGDNDNDPPPQSTDGETSEDPASTPPDQDESQPERGLDALTDMVVTAAVTALPPHLLASLAAGAMKGTGGGAGRSGARRQSRRRGQPAGTQPGDPRGGARISLVETLRAAAPWQPMRNRARAGGQDGGVPGRVLVEAGDIRIRRFKEVTESVTVFAVDASGSLALTRLAEAKGAVELLLADCYVRRDQVAVIGFRGKGAEVLLPPTRSLVRAKRALAGLPGGGGTPIAAGLDAAAALAEDIRRKGRRPVIVVLTDGRANIARDGTADRVQATEDSRQSARRIRASRLSSLVIDVSPRPQEAARDLAAAMGGAYAALPRARAEDLSAAVRAVSD